ncbi:MAG: hypothetical protein HYV42_01525 [Candidatus Magasanikbacteria bacterium]|nr:hypothetical protein [Candidatus Magasanikbacteria bacterium]
MSEPTYRDALMRSWQLVSRHKLLWVWGLLAVLLGQFGLNNFVGNFVALSHPGRLQRFLAAWDVTVPPQFWGAAATPWLLWLLVVVGSVAALTLLLSVGSEGALIAAAGDWFKRREQPDLTASWGQGVRHFWRLLALILGTRLLLAVLLLIGVFFLAGDLSSRSGGALLGSGLALTIIFLLALAISAGSAYAAGFIVLDGLPLGRAVGAGARLFGRHLLVSFELSVVLLLLNFVVLGGLAIFALLTLIPAFLLFLAGGSLAATMLWLLGFLLAGVIFILGAALGGGIFNAFTTTAWIYLFSRMKSERLVSRLWHWVERWVKR